MQDAAHNDAGPAVSAASADEKKRSPFADWRFDKGAFYRTCRMLHAYFSAAAFITLMFFSVTGLMLNHPDWFSPQRDAASSATATLDPAALEGALAAGDQAAALASLVEDAFAVRGGFQSAEVLDDFALLRFTGVKGATDVEIDLLTGEATAELTRANLTSIMHDLHRGKDSGAAWKAFIDISAIAVLALSVVGFVLFFSLRFRLATSLKLVGGSLALMAALIVFWTT